MVGNPKMTKHSTISLNDLIKEYFFVDNDIKDTFQNLMKEDAYLWKKVEIF